MTSEAASTIRPTSLPSTSATRMRFFLFAVISFSPKRLRRSTTETILPRRLITPSTYPGESGTEVISGTRTISCTNAIGTPNVSRPMRKPTMCSSFAMRSLPELVAMRAGHRVVRRSAAALFFATDSAAVAVARAVAVLAAFQHEPVHRLEHGARHLGHLLRRRRQFRRSGRGTLYQLAHLFHRPDHSLRSRRLLFHR